MEFCCYAKKTKERLITSSIAIVIPTKGRPAVLADTLASISRQTMRPAQVVVSATGAEDIPSSAGDFSLGFQTVFGRGGPVRAQRQQCASST